MRSKTCSADRFATSAGTIARTWMGRLLTAAEMQIVGCIGQRREHPWRPSETGGRVGRFSEVPG